MSSKHTDRPSVFISHIAEDAAAASALKQLIHASCGQDVLVFVASDYESIRSGAEWHGVILDAIKSADVLVALLSDVSRGRPWINYEVGAADVQKKLVIPAVIRGLDKGELRPPLARRQARNLEDPNDVRAMVSDISRSLRPTRGDADAVAIDEHLLQQVVEASRSGPAPSSILRLKIQDTDEPTFEGPTNEFHNYDFHVECERPSPAKNVHFPVRVRLRSGQAYNRDTNAVRSLAWWIAQRHVTQYVGKGAEEPPFLVEATEEEVTEFFRDVDPKKVESARDEWIDPRLQ